MFRTDAPENRAMRQTTALDRRQEDVTVTLQTAFVVYEVTEPQ